MYTENKNKKVSILLLQRQFLNSNQSTCIQLDNFLFMPDSMGFIKNSTTTQTRLGWRPIWQKPLKLVLGDY